MAETTEEKMAVTVNNQSASQSFKESGLREEEQKPGQSGQRGSADNAPKKKSTFKITSITKNTQRGGSGGDLAADVDGDSMDDLDESHTEDLSSEILDSSKATDIDQDSALTPEEVVTSKDKPVDAQSRFRVVKIETKEPFRRGRWLCHDFLDTPATSDKNEAKQTDEIHVHSGNSSASSSIHYVHGVDDPSKNPLTAGALGTVIPHQPLDVTVGGAAGFTPKPGETFKPIHPAPQASQPTVLSVTPQRQSTPGDSPVPIQNQHPPQTQGGQPPAQNIVQGNPQLQQPMQLPVATHSNVQVPPAQAVTAPQTSINVHPQPHSQTVPVSVGQSSAVQLLPNQMGSAMQTVTGSGNVVQGQSLDPTRSQNFPLTPTAHPAPQSQMQTGTIPGSLPVVSQIPTPVKDHMSQAPGGPGVPATQVSQNSASQAQYVHASQPGNEVMNNVNAPAQPTANYISNPDNHSTEMMPGGDGGQPIGQLGNMPIIRDAGMRESITRPDSIRLNEVLQASKDQIRESVVQTAAPLLSPLAAAVGGMTSPTQEVKGESGSSTVAIDNKIEQAMDLVKSHLMFAVREEVEVLREQIKELMERIGQLEYENGVLKAAATSETLAKLAQPKSQPPSSTS